MLSDRERNALDEVERRLTADDPTFVRAFDVNERRLLHNRRHRRGARIAAVVALLLSAVLLLAGSPGAAIAVASTTTVVWLVGRMWEEPASGGTP
ncbi:DUF3040 domain-containing protein [Pseudonocardia nigra]|uniref:DUF3040 domain-containing protein n=1 Tax=Pseudonocardia nigra TaxID=1921578 RepID=UPI001C5D15F2|nr:DUF3040 domain-containing protein [Pseudonocardia nigra]